MRRWIVGALSSLVAVAVIAVPTASARVLLVGKYHGVFGPFRSVQTAVDAARAGDIILIGPGDYKEQADHRRHRGAQPDEYPAGVIIAKRNITLRGMNRNSVVIDGTKPGSSRCSSKAGAQDFGPSAGKGKGRLGRNGVFIWQANNVSVQNLTVCNFLNGPAGGNGNEVWWQGGHEAGGIGGHGFNGSYLSATNTYFGTEATASQYGIFSSHWSGGTWDHDYASNFNDSGFYIGACKQVCNQTMNHDQAEFNALGYSGSNSGGRLLIENSEFDQNKDGFDTNSQNGDNPSPQNGACPAGVHPPVHGAPTCWVFTHNYVHDNNNPNVPYAGSAGAGPVGTGMSLSGARNDTIMNNRFVRNNAWGVIVVPYPDSGRPCVGGTVNSPIASCLFDEWGDAILNNSFDHNGRYGHPSNGDVGKINLEDGHPTDCYRGNTEVGRSLSPDLAALQRAFPTCDGHPVASGSSNPSFLTEVLCDSQVSLGSGPPNCPNGQYPRRTKVIMHHLRSQPSMPNPCRGVPANPWCVRGRPA